MTTRYISYLRVSTHRQGSSGLGLDGQREAVTRHIITTGSELIEEFVEVESGRVNERPILSDAMAACKRSRATLVIAKLDRLGRNLAFVAKLMESGADFLALDAPFANRLMLHILAAFAEHEREQIAQRTKAALAMAKARGVKLGANGAVLAATNKAAAKAFAENLAGPIERARKDGSVTLLQIATSLNAQGVKTREDALWTPTAVSRVVSRIGT